MKQRLRALLARFGLQVQRLPRRMLEAPDCRWRTGFEDLLARHLESKSDPSDVFFVQIGAYDGVSGDPIHDHVIRYGWSGILVEPQPRYFEALRRTYAGRPGLELLQAAVAEEPGEAEFFTLDDPEAPELPEWAPQIASFDRDRVLRHRRAIPDLERRLRREIVPCVTMDDLLERAASRSDHLDLIQIDVEGYDHRLVRQIDLTRFAPTLVRFEHKLSSLDEQDEAIRWLARHGYRILREEADTTAYRPRAGAASVEAAAAGSRDT